MATITELPVTLSNDEILRYSRHLIMPEVGHGGQQKLRPRGCCASARAASARRSRCTWPRPESARSGIVDFDMVDYINLQRQILHFHRRRRPPQARLRREKLQRDQSLRERRTFERGSPARTRSNFSRLRHRGRRHRQLPDPLSGQRRVRAEGKPNVYGSIFRFEGQARVFRTEDGPCYRCLYPEPPPPGLVPLR